ncbi:winged helix-turn-helix domain-containing protein [Halorussus salinus]|uniref:winged helix-turn-helix domain-containing protein n=1 Tax=Halorussus salinus TaxID=1364935 RepID=UPI00109295A5|nr:winged helix-turn-helix domain-containing protein [Halorussus salinus]
MGDDKPGRKPQVSDDEILTIFQESEDPVLVASEVADQLPISRRGVYKRLKKLRDQGQIKSKKAGGRSMVWWYPGHTSTPSEHQTENDEFE